MSSKKEDYEVTSFDLRYIFVQVLNDHDTTAVLKSPLQRLPVEFLFLAALFEKTFDCCCMNGWLSVSILSLFNKLKQQ